MEIATIIIVSFCLTAALIKKRKSDLDLLKKGAGLFFFGVVSSLLFIYRAEFSREAGFQFAKLQESYPSFELIISYSLILSGFLSLIFFCIIVLIGYLKR